MNELKKFIQHEFELKLGFKPSLKDTDFTFYNGTSNCKFTINGVYYMCDGWNIYLMGAEYLGTYSYKGKKKIGFDVPEGD